MSFDYSEWGPYVSVAERRSQAAQEVAKLRKKGQKVEPVQLGGRRIAATFWGKAWCDNLESYSDYASRLPRGRAYVRNDMVIDLQIAEREVKALVSGSSIYTVSIHFAALAKPVWRSICRDCAGGIDSLVELLQGRFSTNVMQRLCSQPQGLFPRPAEIRFHCSCPDHASMCKHVAAVLYGVGSRLDERPELLFRLRAVDPNDLLGMVDMALQLPSPGPAADADLAAGDLSALFGIDIEEAAPGVPAGQPPVVKAKAKKGRPAKQAAARKSAATMPKAPDRIKDSSRRVVARPVAKATKPEKPSARRP